MLDPAFQVNPDPDPGVWWPKIKGKKCTWKIFFRGATGKVFNPQKRTSSALKKWNFLTFSYFHGNFCHPGSGSIHNTAFPWGFLIRIRIQLGPWILEGNITRHWPIKQKAFASAAWQFFIVRIRDSGWVKNQDPDSGSRIRIIYPRA